jgi:hypothetical protein
MDGRLFYMVKDKMNTDNMALHLRQLSRNMQSYFVILILDESSSHTTQKLKIPSNIAIIKLPPYSPEHNPTEQIWRMLRGDYFGNRIFDTLPEAIAQARIGLRAMASDRDAITQLTYLPWIASVLAKVKKFLK